MKGKESEQKQSASEWIHLSTRGDAPKVLEELLRRRRLLGRSLGITDQLETAVRHGVDVALARYDHAEWLVFFRMSRHGRRKKFGGSAGVSHLCRRSTGSTNDCREFICLG